MSLVACFDGHGMEGHRCSNFLKQNLLQVFAKCYNQLLSATHPQGALDRQEHSDTSAQQVENKASRSNIEYDLD